MLQRFAWTDMATWSC